MQGRPLAATFRMQDGGQMVQGMGTWNKSGSLHTSALSLPDGVSRCDSDHLLRHSPWSYATLQVM